MQRWGIVSAIWMKIVPKHSTTLFGQHSKSLTDTSILVILVPSCIGKACLSSFFHIVEII
jgi:hypothetical protein